jgi:prevent-host-death family protein
MTNRHHSVGGLDDRHARKLKWSLELDHLKKRTKQTSTQVGATEFKARCLQYMQEVHDRRRNSLTITKRGRPFVRLVPIPAEPHSLYGCLAGLARIHGDLTEPVDATWDAERD